MLRVAVARSFSDDNAIRYVLPFLWITSYLATMNISYGAWLIGRILKVAHQGLTRVRSVLSMIALFRAVGAARLASPLDMSTIRHKWFWCHIRIRQNRFNKFVLHIWITSSFVSRCHGCQHWFQRRLLWKYWTRRVWTQRPAVFCRAK